MAAIRYNIIRINVDRAGQIIRFQHKIPSNLKRCTGFKAVHVRGVQTDIYIPEIGWFTASFNSLKEEAIVSPVSAQAYYNPEVSHEFQTLDVELKAGQLLLGVYVDTMKTIGFSPYIVSLYLRCTEKNIEPIQKNTQPVLKKQSHTNTEESFVKEVENQEQEIITENPDQLCSTT